MHTLGCKLNYAETSSLAAQFVVRGFRTVRWGEETEVFLLNTCSVTENAERECRQIIRRVLRKSPNAFVLVTGCYAQLRPEQIASIEGVDAVLGAREKFEIFEHLSDFSKRRQPLVLSQDIDTAVDFHTASSSSGGSRTRAYLKVQDGCDYTCSFCTIPGARGASRSASIGEIVSQAAEISRQGFDEIILTGVNVGDFGRKSGASFFDLLTALDNAEEVTARLRISSIEPNLLTNSIIELVASSEKLCPHFHIPLQSGSNRILGLMQRRYRSGLYAERIETIKALIPHASIGADVIVGFPGESDLDFEDTYRFLADTPVTYLHVFTYSERPETKALGLEGVVPVAVRRDRNQRLRVLSLRKERAFFESQLGSVVDVVLEANSSRCNTEQSKFLHGHSQNYIPVRVSRDYERAKVVRVKLESITGDTVNGLVHDVLREHAESSVLLPILT